jgi:PAS domain-containing protein
MDAGHADECPAGPGGTGGARRAGASGLGVGIWSWRPADGSLTWSDGVHALLQLPPDQPASWACWLKQVHPDDQDMVRRTLLPPACNKAHAQTLDYRLIRGDGSTIRIEDRRQMDADGTCQGVFIDVTQTVTSGRDSLHAGSCAQRVMEAAGIGVFFRNFENGQDYWNEALYAICGLDRSMSLPACDQLLPVLHPEDKDRVRRQVDACRSSGDTLNLEYRIVTPAGEQRWVRELGCYQTGADGQLLRYYGALQDVTDEKRRTAELEESRSLLTLALEANDMGVWEYNRSTGRPGVERSVLPHHGI